MINKCKLSPMMRHYLEVKEQYPDAVLLYRLGDFYEMFFDDAKVVSQFLDLTLTGRDCGLDERAPMCGVPYHAVDGYIKRLIDGGFKVAICEQLNSPDEVAKGEMVTRDVVRVITAGTLIDDGMLDEKRNNYLAAVALKNNIAGIAWADVSTGEFSLYQTQSEEPARDIEDLLLTLSPAEIIASDDALKLNIPSVKQGRLPRLSEGYGWAFGADSAARRLCKQFNVASLDAFEVADKKVAVSAAGALMEYLLATQKRSLSHINKINCLRDNAFMFLDGNTRRNLELTETMRDRKKRGSLLWLLDDTKTAMGARNLRRWVEQPLQNEKEINERLQSVEELIDNPLISGQLYETLSAVQDIERLSGKIAYGSATPRDLYAIGKTLSVIPQIRGLIGRLKSPLLRRVYADINENTDISTLLERALADNPPATQKDGKFIREGYNLELDELNHAQTDGKIWLANLEAAEREATGIKSLKVGFNKVFGYYIEVSNSFKNDVPLRYQRKQTLVGGERFITEELKDIENKILGAEDRAVKLEQQLFAEIKQTLLERIVDFQQTSAAIAVCDSLLSLSRVAAARSYSKPVVSQRSDAIVIKNGRHPVVEALLDGGAFVPNDTLLDSDENRSLIITGPNMAGKSTYMRQVALITLMAHIGSFVPAEHAEIAVVDRIFTRVGASDDLISGQSTFMVEMIEVATILHNATKRSLLILDEIGRGTSTLDGLSIAWAVLESIGNGIGAKTLFATHFHELTSLEGVLSGVKNYQILIKEISDSIVFLHKIVRGAASKSFGIEVASLAGIPESVVNRARQIMRQLEEAEIVKDTNAIMLDSAAKKTQQLSLFENQIENKAEKQVVSILKDTDINNCSPMQAFAILMDLKEKLNEK